MAAVKTKKKTNAIQDAFAAAAGQSDGSPFGVGGSGGIIGSTINAQAAAKGVPQTTSPVPSYASAASSANNAFANLAASVAPKASTPTPTAPQPTFADYLKQAASMTAPGVDYSGLMNQAKANAAQGAAQLAAIYANAAQGYNSDNAATAKSYQQAGAQVGADTAGATNAINNAYASARAALAGELGRLGIGDAATVGLAEHGDQLTNQQVQALGTAINNGQANANNLVNHAATAKDYNTSIKSATRQQGAQSQANLQQQLQNALANLQTEQATANGSREASIYQLATQLQSAAQNGGLTPEQAAEQQLALQKIVSDQQIAKYNADASSQSKQQSAEASILNSILAQNGGNIQAALSSLSSADLAKLFGNG